MTIPLITLLTDFGDRDYFVASLKGVILNINPQAQIVDLSHHVTPHDVADAAYLLKSCYRYFPDGTIHVAVVDPGVGTSRRAICLAVPGIGYFIGPDNGLFTAILYPSAAIEHSFVGLNVTTKEGQTVMGFTVSETDTDLTLKMAGGATTKVTKSSIVKKDELKDSLMPPGLAGAIGPQGLADLVAWLQTLK